MYGKNVALLTLSDSWFLSCLFKLLCKFLYFFSFFQLGRMISKYVGHAFFISNLFNRIRHLCFKPYFILLYVQYSQIMIVPMLPHLRKYNFQQLYKKNLPWIVPSLEEQRSSFLQCFLFLSLINCHTNSSLHKGHMHWKIKRNVDQNLESYINFCIWFFAVFPFLQHEASLT